MRKIILTILVTISFGACPAKGALWYSSGYNTFTDSDPQGEEIFVENDAVLDFLSGTGGKLSVIHTATVNIYGGAISTKLCTSGNSVINVHLVDLDMLSSAHNSVVNFYAYNVDFYSTGGLENEGYMTGKFYQGDTPFNISFWNPGTVSHVNIVPEPATILLLGMGGLLLRKRK